MAEAGVALMLTADPRAGESRILGDSEALLLGRMMAAIGLNLDELLRLGLPGGVEPDAAGPPPVAIPSARALLLLGDGPSKALLGKAAGQARGTVHQRSEEHTSELQSLMRHSYAVFCLKNKKT